ncbi:FKBP-type peptidyl-prolyl cis-trans isomerase [Hwangdonia seohaensis]|uniref:peptidylprolyl isomerase n=1 Tax=Hwangdonia seohaensis TaxID=1240727 RepID=A0ABW3RBH1_9FLAO|nr:peptidylprolyl isomerase [Hwangdonia seohaensis]
MRKGKIALSILCLIVGFLSCNKDDGGSFTEVPQRDRTEQQASDKDSLVKYLNGHYYNASAFINNTNPSIKDLVITTITDEVISSDADSLLINAVDLKTVKFSETDYEFYILDLNPNAGGESPKFSDQIRVNYEGFTLDNKVFDSAVTPVDFDLISLVPGWRKVMPFFKAAESFTNENDGTVSYTNHGVGVMFLPSGLGYFSNATGGISAYTSIAFKFDLFQVAENDHDNDGIPSYLEDLNGDGEFTLNTGVDTNDGDDTDNDGIPDYFDIDDDGDGVPTLNELEHKTYTVDTNQGEEEPVLAAEEFEFSRSKSAGIITIKTVTIVDSNNDGLADYLDKNIAIDYLE